MLVSARTKQDFPLPNRQYYHSTGFQPMSEAAWLLDLDSDDELCDSEWALPITDAVSVMEKSNESFDSIINEVVAPPTHA